MDAGEIKKLDKAHILHSWVVNAALDPTVISDVDGVYLIDSEGRKILDFSSQLMCVNVGHKNQKIIKAIQEQAEKVCYLYPGFAYESRVKLGQALAEVTPGDLNKFFFTIGGADANDNAIKIARAYTKKHKILARYRSYHGATYGAINLTGDARAIGLFSCLELVKNKKTKEPLSPYNAMGKVAENSTEIFNQLMAKGLFTFVRWMFLFIVPPLHCSRVFCLSVTTLSAASYRQKEKSKNHYYNYDDKNDFLHGI